MPILFHSCCGPCLGGSLPQLKDKELIAFWENPNIHPYLEYKSRFESFLVVAASLQLTTLMRETAYGLNRFLQAIGQAYSRPDRCRICYEIRLSAVALEAKKQGFEAFSTTLLISPYQSHDLLKEVGETTARQVGVPFFYVDLRPGFKGTYQTARDHDLYRQKYCGCIFSEAERYSSDPKHRLPEALR